MKQIIVNVSELSTEEKQRVNEALAKIKGVQKLPAINPGTELLFAPLSSSMNKVSWSWHSLPEAPTHTPQQVLEMAGMAKQGHVHAENMALYAEDAKTTDKPWDLWQTTTADNPWSDLKRNPEWNPLCLYRRKPKTHTVNGVEVPDLRFEPKIDEWYYLVDLTAREFTCSYRAIVDSSVSHRVSRGLCYENTEEGKQAAILHAKSLLGIA